MARRYRADVDDEDVPDQAFTDLLWTWEVGRYKRRHATGRIDPPLSVREKEQHYGVGRHEERGQILRDTLARLRRQGVSTKKVLGALVAAKAACLKDARHDHEFEWAQRFIPERELVTPQLERWCRRAVKLYALALEWQLDQGPQPITIRFDTMEHLQHVLAALEEDPLWTHRFGVPLRRPRRGRQARLWIATARSALAQAKVSLPDREDLLAAVGLVPLPK